MWGKLGVSVIDLKVGDLVMDESLVIEGIEFRGAHAIVQYDDAREPRMYWISDDREFSVLRKAVDGE